MSRSQKDKRAASAALQQQVLQHSVGGTSKVQLKSELESAVEAHFLYGEGDRLFTTQDPTGVEGAANVIKDKNIIIGSSVNHNNLATAGISTLTDMILRSPGSGARVSENVVAAWVAFYTLPKKRTTLAKILQACIAYPSNPQVDVSASDIKICNILPPATATSQQPQQQSWIRSFFSSKPEVQEPVVSNPSCPPIGMRCEEAIKFTVKDVGNNAPVEDVLMTIRYDLVAVRNASGTDDVELRDLSFCVTAAELDDGYNTNKCVWKARQRCNRVFLSTELDLIRAASELEAADMPYNSVISGNSSRQTSGLTYRQRLQALLDEQEMEKKAEETRARISSQSTHTRNPKKQILFKDVEFLKNNKDVCTRIFVSSHQEAEEMLGEFVHTVIADSCADKKNTKPEYFQKISFKIPVKGEHEEKYKVIEHGSVHIPLSEHNIHALLSYTVTKRVVNSEHKPDVAISEAKLGVRHVPVGFKLHNCSWVRYRSTDFITFAIPDLTHTCVTSTLPTCWHQAKEYRALVSPYPTKAVGVTSKQQKGIALAEYRTAAPVAQPGQGANQKPWATGISEKKPGAQSETKGDPGKRGTDYAASGNIDTHGTTDFVELDRQEHWSSMEQRWIDQMVTQASTHCTDADEHSFESYTTRFVEAHKQPNAGSHTRRSVEAFDDDAPQGSFGFNNIEEPEPQSELESGRHSTKEKSASHGSGRSKVTKPLPHSGGKPQSRLLWLLSAIWKSILLILQFLIVTPLVYIYKLCTQYAAQSPTTTTDAPEEASDKSAKKSATEKQKESTSFFSQFRRRTKNSSAATNKTDAATTESKKQEKCNKSAASTPTPGKSPDKEEAKHATEQKNVQHNRQKTGSTVPTDTKSNTEHPSDEAEVPSTLQEPEIENAFFEDYSVLYPA